MHSWCSPISFSKLGSYWARCHIISQYNVLLMSYIAHSQSNNGSISNQRHVIYMNTMYGSTYALLSGRSSSANPGANPLALSSMPVIVANKVINSVHKCIPPIYFELRSVLPPWAVAPSCRVVGQLAAELTTLWI